MTTDTDYRPLVVAGRCRSGRRWFWTAVDVRTGEARAEGWAEDQVEAEAAMLEAARRLGDCEVYVRHRIAYRRVREINEERRRQRPAPATSDTRPVEYLYSPWWGDEDGWSWVRMPITKKTARRIYFRKEWGGGTYFVDRQRIEAGGSLYHHPLRNLIYLEPDEPEVPDIREELRRLRLAMAEAHPDRGGSHERFIAAHRDYEAARARFGRMPA